MIRRIFATLGVIIGAVGFIGSASAQSRPYAGCTINEKAQPADANYKAVTVMRPVTGIDSSRYISVELSGMDGLDRNDAGRTPTPLVESVQSCGPKKIVTLRTSLTEITKDNEVTSVMIPAAAKEVVIVSCSQEAKTCFGGKFAGDFSKPVVLEDVKQAKATAQAQKPKPPAKKTE